MMNNTDNNGVPIYVDTKRGVYIPQGTGEDERVVYHIGRNMCLSYSWKTCEFCFDRYRLTYHTLVKNGMIVGRYCSELCCVNALAKKLPDSIHKRKVPLPPCQSLDDVADLRFAYSWDDSYSWPSWKTPVVERTFCDLCLSSDERPRIACRSGFHSICTDCRINAEEKDCWECPECLVNKLVILHDDVIIYDKVESKLLL
jgi:hypothetical protein